MIRPAPEPAEGSAVVLRKAAIAPHTVPVGAARRAMSAPQEAPSVVVDHDAELRARAEQAQKQGYEAGLAIAAEEAKRALARRCGELDTLAKSIEQAHARALESLEDIALGIAWEAVCKLLGEAALDKAALLALVQQSIGRVKDEPMLVRVNPADLALLKEHLSAASFTADPAIELGGCIIEAGGGWIDARLETQLERLRQALLAARAARREQP
jgi:flagellar assembly protein FliH